MTIQSIVKMGNQQLMSPSVAITDFAGANLKQIVTDMHDTMRAKGYDLDQQPITRVAEGFHARVLQHECDHLDGILYPRRINDLRFLGFEDELETF